MGEDVIVVEEEMVEQNTAVSPAETSRRLVMAGIGAIVVVGGAVKSRVSRFIESEELTAEDEQPHHRRRRLRNPADSLLTRLNVPTKTDIDALNSQVTALLDKVEALQEQEQLAQQPRPSLSPTADTIQTVNE